MKARDRLSTILIGAIFTLAIVAVAASRISAADAPTLRVVYNALGGSMAPIWVSQELGLFAKHGCSPSKASMKSMRRSFHGCRS
jgi:ABC-type nitrate/sulfonate/bicarbonate transport system substrate-binding protein